MKPFIKISAITLALLLLFILQAQSQTYDYTIQGSIQIGYLYIDSYYNEFLPATYHWTSGTSHRLEAYTHTGMYSPLGGSGSYPAKFEFTGIWQTPDGDLGNPASITVGVNTPGTYYAKFKPMFTMQLSLSPLPDGATPGSPYFRFENETIYATSASGYVYANPEIGTFSTASSYYASNTKSTYSFDHWSNGWTSSGMTMSWFEPVTLQAYYRTSAIDPVTVTTIGGTVGYPVLVDWEEHPNPNVPQYEIWRKTKLGSPMLIATISRGTTQYSDREYKVTSGFSDSLVSYKVKAHYSSGGTQLDSETSWYAVYAKDGDMKIAQASLNSLSVLEGEQFGFAVSAYPNPFNPLTTIQYSLPEAAHVSLKVFDVMGREVVTLVNQEQNAGNHQVRFDASKLPSGVYLYRIDSGNYTQTKRLVLTK